MDYDWLFGESFETLEDCPETSQSSKVPIEPIWTTAKGDKIPLSKMETRHITNCMRLLEDKPYTAFSKKWLCIFGNELARRKSTPLERGFSL